MQALAFGNARPTAELKRVSMIERRTHGLAVVQKSAVHRTQVGELKDGTVFAAVDRNVLATDCVAGAIRGFRVYNNVAVLRPVVVAESKRLRDIVALN